MLKLKSRPGIVAFARARNPALSLVATREAGLHRLGLQLVGVLANRSIRVTAWVKAPQGTRINVDIRDGKARGGEPKNSGTAAIDVWPGTVLASTGNVRTSTEIGPGDWVFVDIHELAFNQWQVTIVDGQQVFQRQIQYPSSHSSAEWIVEDPSTARGLVPLATVTGANFANMMAIANGQSTVPVQLSPQTTVLVGATGQVEASPSALGPGGDSFGVAATL